MLIFGDMAIYSFVKNNTFNGMPLPDLAVLKKNGQVENIKRKKYIKEDESYVYRRIFL